MHINQCPPKAGKELQVILCPQSNTFGRRKRGWKVRGVKWPEMISLVMEAQTDCQPPVQRGVNFQASK